MTETVEQSSPEQLPEALAPEDGVQYAQAKPAGEREPIGHADTVTGKVQATHANGEIKVLANGDPIYQGDLLTTGPKGAAGIVFMDETMFSMGENARTTIDEMVYDPGSKSGSMAISLARGAFTFVSGQVAKVDPEGMVFKTPSAVIGIRGSVGGINVNERGHTMAALFEEIGGISGEMIFKTGAGVEIINRPSLAMIARGYDAPPSRPFSVKTEEIAANFGSAIQALPKAEEHLPPIFHQEVERLTEMQQSGLAPHLSPLGHEGGHEGEGPENIPGGPLPGSPGDIPGGPGDIPGGPGDIPGDLPEGFNPFFSQFGPHVPGSMEDLANFMPFGDPNANWGLPPPGDWGFIPIDFMPPPNPADALPDYMEEHFHDYMDYFEEYFPPPGGGDGGTGGVINGTPNDDLLYGSAGNDMIFGFAGNDSIYGGDGNDAIAGGPGADFMEGGNGEDRFVYTSPAFGIGDMDGSADITDARSGDVFVFSGLWASLTMGGSPLSLFSGSTVLPSSLNSAVSNIALVDTDTGAGYDWKIQIDYGSDGAADQAIDVADAIAGNATFYDDPSGDYILLT